MDAMEREAFEDVARCYPHEMAELDWPAFVMYTRKVVGWEIPEETIRQELKRTAGSE
jgi:hypothetical protein